MTQTNKIEQVGVGLLGVALAGLLAWWAFSTLKAEASAPIGLPASIATTSTIQVGLDEEKVIFNGGVGLGGVTRMCSSRIISTKSDAILINFGGTSTSTATTTVLSSLEGHLQAASTTVAYDGGLYGCGYWGARSVGTGSSTITTTELN